MITPAYAPTATERVLPRLALDFTTGTLDPRVTVARALNTATRVNSSGYVEGINADLPRFDYDPVTLAPKGLLIEEARANLFLQSQTFEAVSWVKTLSTISSDAANGPDNLLTADKLTPNNGAAFGGTWVHQQINKAASAITYTASVFAKPDGYDYILLRCQDSGGAVNRANVTVNVATGAIVTAAATAGTFSNASAKVTPFANGFFRVELTFTSSADTALRSIVFPTDSGGTVGDGVKGVLLWGAQLEAGAFATSYIPTTTTSLTRNADAVSMTGTNFSSWYNASAGTFQIELNSPPSTSSIVFAASRSALGASLNDSVSIDVATSSVRGIVRDGANVQCNLGMGAQPSAGATFKATIAYANNNFGASLNGGATVTDLTGNVPSTSPDQLVLGNFYNIIPINSHFRRVEFWPQRLTNSELRAFSK